LPDQDDEFELLDDEFAAAFFAYVLSGAYLGMSWRDWIKSRAV
jgi:hypothetical protein